MTAAERPVVVKFSSPTDIVGAIPSFVGFHPAESLVVMCLRGPRRRSGLTMRIDLVDPRHDDVVSADTASRVVRGKADSVIVASYTAALDEGDRLPRSALIDLISEQLLRRGVSVVEALLIRDGRWFSYSCRKPCCPREGTAIPSIPDGALARLDAERALHGRAILPSREVLEASVRGPVALRRIAIGQVYDRVGDAVVEEIERAGPDAFRSTTVALARTALDRYVSGQRDLDDVEAARITLGLHDKHARDELTTWSLDAPATELIALLTDLAQRTLNPDAAPICTVLGSVAYQQGEGALASVALERALCCDPGYEMARLLTVMLQGQVDPAQLRAVSRGVRRDLRRR